MNLALCTESCFEFRLVTFRLEKKHEYNVGGGRGRLGASWTLSILGSLVIYRAIGW